LVRTQRIQTQLTVVTVEKMTLITQEAIEMTKTRTKVETLTWAYIKRESGLYEASDNNGGLTFGIHYMDDTGQDVQDAEWYVTEDERAKVIKTEDLDVIGNFELK